MTFDDERRSIEHQLKELSREAVPSPDLRRRVRDRLIERGVIEPSGPKQISIPIWRVWRAAAVIAIAFLSGTAFGEYRSHRTASLASAEAVIPEPQASGLRLQRLGSEYAASIAALRKADAPEWGPLREVALATLRGAAEQVGGLTGPAVDEVRPLLRALSEGGGDRATTF